MRERGCLNDPYYVGHVCPMRRIDDYYRHMLNNPPPREEKPQPQTERKAPIGVLQATIFKNEEEEKAKLDAKHA
jgi:hypothetical protein